MQSRAALAVMLAAIVAGCGDDRAPGSGDDAGLPDVADASQRAQCEVDFVLPASECWSTENTVMKGEAILGAGEFAFEPMGDELILLEQGQLSELHFIANMRMRGLNPGDPVVSWGDPNPRARIVPYFEDSGRQAKSSPCPIRTAFEPVDSETFGRLGGMGVPVPFDPCWTTQHLLDRRLIIRLEIVDACGSYAVAEQVATLRAQPGYQYANVEGPGCPE